MRVGTIASILHAFASGQFTVMQEISRDDVTVICYVLRSADGQPGNPSPFPGLCAKFLLELVSFNSHILRYTRTCWHWKCYKRMPIHRDIANIFFDGR